MKPQQRKMLAGAIFFAGGPLLCLLAVGVEALAGYGWAMIAAIIARSIID
jgi:hypothetical protein